MTTFLLACAGLVLLSGVFFLFTPQRRGTSEEDLDRATRRFVAVQPGGNDPTVVGNQEISGVQIISDFTEATMFYRPVIAVQDEQTAAVTRLRGLLRDKRMG